MDHPIRTKPRGAYKIFIFNKRIMKDQAKID